MPSTFRYSETRQREHPNCVICGNRLADGLGLRFEMVEPKVVQATFDCDRYFEGYPNILHGGVVCSLLDAAMTNSLFSQGIAAVTGDMNVRFREPIETDRPAFVRGWVEASQDPLFKMAAELLQDGAVKASANARFVDRRVVGRLVRTTKEEGFS
ncbi:PaaI family thioesterase [Novipirellula artificiosorum]|uniref:Acyl-coenzyme A thioesterase THEM4 n=1 Tax=Novipirellula artificiosorum TaxID=2528016 RepID=A0A5C6DX37_9BACT|nr:PaaI family thioesterase [Novipirellula artificiosorum]TWU40955.1 Thioesterase superfamily protein [Novipirellula artificiosorum]